MVEPANSRLIQGMYSHVERDIPKPSLTFREFSSVPVNRVIRDHNVYRYTIRCSQCRRDFYFYFREAEMYEHELYEKIKGTKKCCRHIRRGF